MKHVLLLLLVLFAGCSSTPADIGDEAVTQMAVTDKLSRDLATLDPATVVNPKSGLTVGHVQSYLVNTWRFENAVAVDSGVLDSGSASRPTSRPVGGN